jgi:hypothetical protein
MKVLTSGWILTIVSFIAFLCSFSVFTGAEVTGLMYFGMADWYYVGTNIEVYQYYYDHASIQFPSPGLVQVWGKEI